MLKDGFYSALLVKLTGTFATPLTWAELDLLTGALDVPWAVSPTKSESRRARDGDIFFDGQGQYATAVDITCENDDEDSTLQLLKDAENNKTKIVVAFCPHLKQAHTPPDDASYIKGEYRVFGGKRSGSPGKSNMIEFQLRRSESCALAVMVDPA